VGIRCAGHVTPLYPQKLALTSPTRGVPSVGTVRLRTKVTELYTQITVWYAERPPCIPDSHLYRVTNTRCRIGTLFSPNDGHIFARNMSRKAINILRISVHQVGSIYKKNCAVLQRVSSLWFPTHDHHLRHSTVPAI
jgi:hypothetical protein